MLIIAVDLLTRVTIDSSTRITVTPFALRQLLRLLSVTVEVPGHSSSKISNAECFFAFRSLKPWIWLQQISLHQFLDIHERRTSACFFWPESETLLACAASFSYAIVSGDVGSFKVLFAKSISNLLRLPMSSNYELQSWFTYSMPLLFLCTTGFWVSVIAALSLDCFIYKLLELHAMVLALLNEGLSFFDAILIFPMF
ncbi:uncharacterized protein LOC125478196 [Pyrus x bretschneideri]|uniref:uncharacterized protein LOC125478196 n=1 Tax=Pyrus x bretschneideri TaxID=225117 RepID=UPI00202FB32F|nr:uncharacterized protein LOC125478196 [Pyrus x bretschneideri]